MTPTRFGEGKTTTSISLVQGLARIGERPILCLREPSLGRCSGSRTARTGGGRAQLVPMEEINLHFTGDIHAIGAANNLLAAMVDAQLLHGNELGLDQHSISWRRCMDMDDRTLRQIVLGLGGRANDIPREAGFDITAASEVMAVVAVARDLADLRARLGAITVGSTIEGEPVTAEQIGAAGSMTVLLKEALKPNLVQTTEGNPALVHCGPFANIAHGNNSLLADRLGMKLGEYVVTESGFGADMGFEKFVDIVSGLGGFSPNVVVFVATVQALKHHGGDPDGGLPALERGFDNLRAALGIVRQFDLNCVIATNRFHRDEAAEIDAAPRERARRGGRRRQRGVRARRRGNDRACRGRRRGRDRAHRARLPPPARGADREEDRGDRDPRLRRSRYRAVTSGAGAGRDVRGRRARRPADLHGEDTSVSLARPDLDRCPERVHAARARAARLHRRGLDRGDVRRHADDARPAAGLRCAAHRSDAAGATVGLR